MLVKANENEIVDSFEKKKRIRDAAKYYGLFLESLGFDYEADEQTKDTPLRVAKAWVEDLVKGSMTEAPKVTTFPNEEGYDGIVIQTGIKVNSMCAHRGMRGVQHPDSLMTTNKFSGRFLEKDNLVREEFMNAIKMNKLN